MKANSRLSDCGNFWTKLEPGWGSHLQLGGSKRWGCGFYRALEAALCRYAILRHIGHEALIVGVGAC